MEGSRSVQMMCSHPHLSSIDVTKAVFAQLIYTGDGRSLTLVMCGASLLFPCLLSPSPWLNRWHQQLIGLYAGEDSSPRGNSPGQIPSHCVVQSAVSVP